MDAIELFFYNNDDGFSISSVFAAQNIYGSF